MPDGTIADDVTAAALLLVALELRTQLARHYPILNRRNGAETDGETPVPPEPPLRSE